VEEWENDKENTYLRISEELFDETGHFSVPVDIWKDEWLERQPLPRGEPDGPGDDDIPF
jgi:hypothetical protein